MMTQGLPSSEYLHLRNSELARLQSNEFGFFSCFRLQTPLSPAPFGNKQTYGLLTNPDVDHASSRPCQYEEGIKERRGKNNGETMVDLPIKPWSQWMRHKAACKTLDGNWNLARGGKIGSFVIRNHRCCSHTILCSEFQMTDIVWLSRHRLHARASEHASRASTKKFAERQGYGWFSLCAIQALYPRFDPAEKSHEPPLDCISVSQKYHRPNGYHRNSHGIGKGTDQHLSLIVALSHHVGIPFVTEGNARVFGLPTQARQVKRQFFLEPLSQPIRRR